MQPLPDLVPGKNPDRIILNLTEDPATSMAVTWRTDSTVTKPFAQILPVQPEPQIPSETALISAKTERYVNGYEDEPR
jgi:hypothetical protein